MTVMLTASHDMNKDRCINNTQRLYLIDGYSHYYYENESFNWFLNTTQSCIFNTTLNYNNETKVSFYPTYEYKDLLEWQKQIGVPLR